MKRLYLSITGLFFSTILLTACGGGGGSSGDSSSGGNSGGGGGNTVSPTEIYINVSDAFAGNVWSDVTLKFSGASVNDDSGSISEKVLVADANKSFVVETKGLAATDSIVVTAKSPGYLDTGASVIVSPGDERHEINLKMVRSLPGRVIEGIYNAEMDISPYIDDNGTTTDKIELTSKDMTDPANPGPGVSISIPSGTTLYAKDDDGNDVPVTTGMLKVTSFDPYQPKAIQAFPGGFNVTANADNFVDRNGNAYTGDTDINFKTAGFAAISIESEAGQKVKKFSQDATISMEVKQGTTDPEGKPVVDGTTIPMWSYDEDTGKWDYENLSSAMTGTSGDFGTVSLDTSHLTYWNLDWHYGPKCNPRFLFLLPNDAPNTTTDLSFQLTIGSTPPIYRTFNNYQNDGFLQLYNVPAGAGGSLEIFDGNGNLLQTLDVDDFCDGEGNGVIVKTTIPELEILASQIELDFQCPGGGDVPGFPGNTSVPFEALLIPVGQPFTTGLMANGTGEVNLIEGSNQDYNLIPNNPAQTTLFAAIADQGSTSFNIVAGQDFSHTFELTEAFCTGGPSGLGTINGVDTSNLNDNFCAVPGDTDDDSTTDNNRPRAMDVARDSNGTLYFSVWDPITGEGSIQKFDSNNEPEVVISGNSNSVYPDYTPTIITGSGPNGTNIKTKRPMGLDIHSTNQQGDVLYYADYDAHCVNAILLDTKQVVSVAGKCGEHGNQPNDASRERVTEVDYVRLRHPVDVAADNSGYNVYISDYVNRKIRMVGSDTDTDRIAETLFAGNAYQVYMRTLAGSIDPGQGNPAPNPASQYADGDSALGLIPSPGGIAVAPDNTLLMTGGNMVTRIENISPTTGVNEPQDQTLKRVAGMYNIAGGGPGINGGIGDGGPAVDAKLTLPVDVEVDLIGNILVSDQSEHRVKRIEATTGEINTVAGTGSHSWAVTCGTATLQTTSNPRGIWSERNSGSTYDFDFTQYGNVPNWVRQVQYQ